MGQSKQRQQTEGDRYGQPQIYTLQILSKDSATLAEIPMPIKRKRAPLLTDQSAIGMAGAIVYYLVNHTQPTRQVFWNHVETSIAQYCSNLAAVPDLAGLQTLADELPLAFWAQILRPEGAIVQSRADGKVCDVVLASREGVAPHRHDTEMRQWQGDRFHQMLQEAG